MSKATERALQAKIELAKAKLQEALARAAQINELTAEIDALRAENERLRRLVRSLADSYVHYERGSGGSLYSCHYCAAEGDSRDVPHFDHCIVGQARAALEGES